MLSRTPTMATLVMWLEVAIEEDWSRLRLCGLKIDERMELRPLRGGLQVLLMKELQTCANFFVYLQLRRCVHP